MRTLFLFFFSFLFFLSCSSNKNESSVSDLSESPSSSSSISQSAPVQAGGDTAAVLMPPKNPNSLYSFDAIEPYLQKETTPQSDEITQWIKKSINAKNADNLSSICTKECEKYLGDIPDDIMLGMEEDLEKYKRKFNKKWGNKFDMNRIPDFAPFGYCGNGGPCEEVNLCLVKYLGRVSGEFYYRITVGDDPGSDNNINLIIVVIDDNGKYRIDNLMTADKREYFSI